MMFQTHTRVTDRAAQKKQRETGSAAALKAVASAQLFTQLLLWITFFGYDRAQQTVWQAVLMIAPVWIALYLVWKNAGDSRWTALPLLLCLQLDSCLVLFAVSGFIGQLIPQYPPWVGVLIPTAACFAIVLTARVRGVGYGTAVFKWLLMGLFLFSTVFLRASNRADRLWPLLGDGLGSTALAALSGAGSVWACALIFALPKSHTPKKNLRWVLMPWALGLVWALWFGFVRPWAAGDSLAVAEKIMGLARHAMSVVTYELAGVLWMLLLPLSLCGCAASAELLASRAFPKLPRMIPLALALLPSCVVLLIWPGEALAVLETLLPWRAVIALLCGLIGLIRKEKK